MGVEWQTFVTPGLGDNSYLLYSEGEALLVDPQRDAWRFLEFAAANKLRLRYVLETHVHNDYVSGAMEVRAATGAEIAAPAGGNYKFDYLRMQEGDEVRLGTARLVCVETPGHTPEHISWILYEKDTDGMTAVFSGGSLLVGGAGRTDLLGAEWTNRLTRAQFHTIRKLSALPANVVVLPTHGSGSFCASGSNRQERFTSIREERKQNPLIQLNSEQEFMSQHLRNLPAFPAYYEHMPPINRRGAVVLKSLPEVIEVSADQLAKSNAWILDVRDRKAFADAHIAGSINIEMDETFGTYAGWLLPFGTSIILIADPSEPDVIREATVQLIRIGYERILGYLKGGIETWINSGNAVGSYSTGSIRDLCADFEAGKARLIDVRQKKEWDEAHVTNSIHAFVGDLFQKVPNLSNGEWSVACVSGYRSAIAASILNARGVKVRLITPGGIPDFLKECPQAKAI